MQKSLAKNSVYSMIYKLLNTFYPLATSIYLARILLPEGVGKVTLAQNISFYFITFAALGIPNYGIKMIGGVQNDWNERSKIFSELFLINLISSSLSFFSFYIFLYFFPDIADFRLLIIFSSQILLNILNIDWFYQGIEEYGYITTRSMVVKCVSFLMMLLFVKSKEDYLLYGAILCIASVGNHVFNFVYVRKFARMCFNNIKIKKHLRPIFILLASACATEIYTMLDSTMVGTMCSESELAYYSTALKIVRSSIT